MDDVGQEQQTSPPPTREEVERSARLLTLAMCVAGLTWVYAAVLLPSFRIELLAIGLIGLAWSLLYVRSARRRGLARAEEAERGYLPID